MSKGMNRRNFIKASTALVAVSGVKNTLAAFESKPEEKQEYYELRIYKSFNVKKQRMIDKYLEKALLPALQRMGINRIGVFKNMDKPEDFSTYVLIPYPTLEIFAAQNSKLQKDKQYLQAAKEYFAAPKDDPLFSRIQSKFYKAFMGMPVIEMPKQTADNLPRIFELRIYESHTEEKAALKVDMFNNGEIQIMRDTELAPVFYGEALIGDDIPNLAYMTSASDRETHKAHWSKFGSHPDWKRMKEMQKYKDTVSKITKVFLIPTSYSQL